jgi:hypothetical protein
LTVLMHSALSPMAFRFDNWGADPSATPGTSVVPGVSGAFGSFTQVASSANVAQDVYFVTIQVFGGNLTAVSKKHTIDLGVDINGGTSYTTVVSELLAGCSPAFTTCAGVLGYSFPLFIKAGSSVAVRIKGSHTTAGTVRVCITFRGQPAAPHLVPVASRSERIGAIASTAGVAFTPGNAADGTWVSLGTTTLPNFWWQLGWNVDNTGMTVEYCYIELAHGDATNKHTLIKMMKNSTTTEQLNSPLLGNWDFAGCYWPLPAGTELWVRGRADSAPDSGYNACAYGFGG